MARGVNNADADTAPAEQVVVVVVTAAFYYLLSARCAVTGLLLMPARELSKLRGQVPCQPPASEIPRFGAL